MRTEPFQVGVSLTLIVGHENESAGAKAAPTIVTVARENVMDLKCTSPWLSRTAICVGALGWEAPSKTSTWSPAEPSPVQRATVTK
jgi:hypothetical protein